MTAVYHFLFCANAQSSVPSENRSVRLRVRAGSNGIGMIAEAPVTLEFDTIDDVVRDIARRQDRDRDR